MNFANLSPLAVAGGIAALAAILYALQKLRTRFQEKEVSTLLFWKEAVNEAPVRTFTQRFKHVWAYLLLLAICSLVWLAIAEPQWQGEEGSDFYVLLLDGSAGMARDDRFERAVAELKDDLMKLPSSQRQVIWCGTTVRTLLNPGEHELLLEQRLQGLQPESTPSSVEAQLIRMAAVKRGESVTRVRIYGKTQISTESADHLNRSIDIKLASEQPAKSGNNRSITALGIAESDSAEWGRMDVLWHIAQEKQLPVVFDVQVDGQSFPQEKIEAVSDGGTYRIRGIEANGQLLSVTLQGEDPLSLDDVAQLRLPELSRIRVLLSDSLKEVLLPALEADTAVEVVDSDADLVIRRRSESIGESLPALEFVPSSMQEAAFLLSHPGTQDDSLVLSEAVNQIGLRSINAEAIATATGKPISVAVENSGRWRFSVWQELLDEDLYFTQSRAFPLFIAHSLRWLSTVEQWFPYVAVGQRLESAFPGSKAALLTKDGAPLDTLGASIVPVQAGELAIADKKSSLIVSLLDPSLAEDQTVNHNLSYETLDGFNIQREGSPIIWLLLLVLLLAAFEWMWFQKGRMP